MNGKVAIVVSIFAAMLRLLPGMSMTSPIQSNVHQYQVGNEKVIFNGKQVFISFGNSSEKVSWIIEKMTPSGLRTEHLAHFRVKRIVNAYQNSAVLIENNSQVRIAEIYSFSHDSIDASIAVKNLNPRNATYVVTFVVVTNHRDHVSTIGYSGGSINLPMSPNTVFAPISPQSWIYSDRHILISWQNEMALFHSGILMSNTRNNIISLPFGPFSLSTNETYSIDPIIRPDRLPGGGGGGSSGSPPTASLSLPGVSSSTNTFVAGTGVTLAAYVSSMGSYNPDGTTYVTMDFYALTSGGGQTFLFQKTVTSTGTHDYTWTPGPGYYTGVKMEYGGYWGQGTPSQVNQAVKVFDQLSNSKSGSGPTDAAAAAPVYDDSGNLAGYITLQVEGPINTPIPTYSTPRLQLESSFVVSSNSIVDAIMNFTDTFTLTGNSANDINSEYMTQVTQGIFDGAGQNGTWGVTEYALWTALTVLLSAYSIGGAAIMTALGVLFFTSYSSSAYTGYNTLTVAIMSFPTVFYRSGTLDPNWYFNVWDQIGFQTVAPSGTTESNAVLDYFVYSGSFGFSTQAQDFATSLSESIYIGQY